MEKIKDKMRLYYATHQSISEFLDTKKAESIQSFIGMLGLLCFLASMGLDLFLTPATNIVLGAAIVLLAVFTLMEIPGIVYRWACGGDFS